MARLRIQLDLSERPDDDGSVVHVVVRDTSMADGLHPEVAQASVPLREVQSGQVVVEMPEEAMSPRSRYTLFAHVDRSGDGTIQSGDLISTENIPVTIDDLEPEAAPVGAKVRRI